MVSKHEVQSRPSYYSLKYELLFLYTYSVSGKSSVMQYVICRLSLPQKSKFLLNGALDVFFYVKKRFWTRPMCQILKVFFKTCLWECILFTSLLAPNHMKKFFFHLYILTVFQSFWTTNSRISYYSSLPTKKWQIFW